MDFLIQNGINWIIAIQSLGSWLELPMKFFSFLGYVNFFFLVLPLIYWSIHTGLGFRIALILTTSNYLNSIAKLLFAAPVSIQGIVTSAGSLFGLAAAAPWIASRGGYEASGPLEKRAFRYVIGLIGIMILWFGLGEVFPRGETFIPLILRYIRYFLVGL